MKILPHFLFTGKCRMEEAGPDKSIINLCHWRGQSGTLYKNYIKYPNRA